MSWRRLSRLLPQGGAALVAWAGLGCGAVLQVRSVPVPGLAPPGCAGQRDKAAADCAERQQALYDSPGGIVVNQRTRYSVSVQPREDLGIELAPARLLEAIDHAHLVSINYRRQPFANAVLSLRLDAVQAVESVGIQGDPGSVPLAESLAAAAEARREFREAEEKRDQTQGAQ